MRLKLRRIGNSQGIYLPLKVITGYNIGDMVEVEVITKDNESGITPPKVITPKPEKMLSGKYSMCPKHPGSMKITCGCK